MRCHEAVTQLPGSYDIVINIQGDEPLMEPEIIDGVVRALQDTPDCNYRWFFNLRGLCEGGTS